MPVPPPAPPLPAPAGGVKPCCFRQATNDARVELEAALEALVVAALALPELLPPQAATAMLQASVAAASDALRARPEVIAVRVMVSFR